MRLRRLKARLLNERRQRPSEWIITEAEPAATGESVDHHCGWIVAYQAKFLILICSFAIPKYSYILHTYNKDVRKMGPSL